jgi:hypothetical protein
MLVSLRRSFNARRLAAAAGLTMVAAAPAPAQGAAALPPAKELIAKFVAATNATAIMAKHQSVRTKGRFELPAQGISGDLEISQARPNKTMMRINISSLGQIEQGYDGTTAWSINPMQGPRLMTGRELDAVREESSFGTPSRQGPNVASAETVEKTEMNGEPCSKGTIEVTNLISDYKDFGGQKIATRLTQQVMGNEQVLILSTVDYDAADAASFEMPAAIKALVEKKP